jgi:hypothetical protein
MNKARRGTQRIRQVVAVASTMLIAGAIAVACVGRDQSAPGDGARGRVVAGPALICSLVDNCPRVENGYLIFGKSLLAASLVEELRGLVYCSESARLDQLTKALSRATAQQAIASKEVRGVMAVSGHILAPSDAAEEQVKREAEAVIHGKHAPLRFLSTDEECNWASEQPNGLYTTERELRRLWWVSRYIRVYRERWSSELRAEFESLLQHDPKSPERACLSPTVLTSQRGTTTGTAPTPDVTSLVAKDLQGLEPLIHIETAMAAMKLKRGSGVRDLWLELCRSVARDKAESRTWRTSAEVARAMKRSTVAHLYVGMIEADLTSSLLLRRDPAQLPILVDLSTELAEQFVAVGRTLQNAAKASGLDPSYCDRTVRLAAMMMAIENARRAASSASDVASLEQQLIQYVLDHCKWGSDTGSETRIAGFDRPLRRGAAHLVEIPIVVMGREAVGYTLEFGVEEQTADAGWRPLGSLRATSR